MPTAVAIQCVEVTTPNVPSISGRVVNGLGLILDTVQAWRSERSGLKGPLRTLSRTRLPGKLSPRRGRGIRGVQ